MAMQPNPTDQAGRSAPAAHGARRAGCGYARPGAERRVDFRAQLESQFGGKGLASSHSWAPGVEGYHWALAPIWGEIWKWKPKGRWLMGRPPRPDFGLGRSAASAACEGAGPDPSPVGVAVQADPGCGAAGLCPLTLHVPTHWRHGHILPAPHGLGGPGLPRLLGVGWVHPSLSPAFQAMAGGRMGRTGQAPASCSLWGPRRTCWWRSQAGQAASGDAERG